MNLESLLIIYIALAAQYILLVESYSRGFLQKKPEDLERCNERKHLQHHAEA